MKKIWHNVAVAAFIAPVFVACSGISKAQSGNNEKLLTKTIQEKEVKRIIDVLAADEMRGRRTFSPEIDKAADFIAAEFKQIGLEPWKEGSYKQSFAMISLKDVSLDAKINNAVFDSKQVMIVSTAPDITITQQSGYEQKQIKAGANLLAEARSISQEGKNTIVWVDESFAANFSRLSFLKRNLFPQKHSVVFVLKTNAAAAYSFVAKQEVSEMPLANVVGVLPGKSKKEEYVIFSGHYDHIGVGKSVNGDSIFNGANDDASGITAMILLAKYYKALNNNERTLIFAAFTAEEVGGFGSQYFSKQYQPERVMAMFNIEMIGTDAKWGNNAAYITGYEKSSMGDILQKNLKGTSFQFHPDPYTDQQLFYRSDNATLARLGVPAHTISTSKMDSEPNYHKVSDEVSTLDLKNMTEIIKAIALSAGTIVNGTDTPSRVDTGSLR